MNHNHITFDHSEISGGVSGNNLDDLSSSVRRTLLRCCHCHTVSVHDQYLYEIYVQNLPLWCGNCGGFNSQWGFRITDFPNYRRNTTDNSNLFDQMWQNWVNVQLSVEDHNRGAVASFEGTEEIDNNGGRDDSHRNFDYYNWNEVDSESVQLCWEYLMNVQLVQNQNIWAAQTTEEEEEEEEEEVEEEEEEDNFGYKEYREELIRRYLSTRDCRKSGNKEEEGEICVICQNEFEEEEVFKRLDCGHDYHFECIKDWLLLQNSCPLCVCTVVPIDSDWSNFDSNSDSNFFSRF